MPCFQSFPGHSFANHPVAATRSFHLAIKSSRKPRGPDRYVISQQATRRVHCRKTVAMFSLQNVSLHTICFYMIMVSLTHSTPNDNHLNSQNPLHLRKMQSSSFQIDGWPKWNLKIRENVKNITQWGRNKIKHNDWDANDFKDASVWFLKSKLLTIAFKKKVVSVFNNPLTNKPEPERHQVISFNTELTAF